MTRRWTTDELSMLPEGMVAALPGKATAHKYGAEPTVVDGIRFPSKLQAGHYQQLKLLKSAGVIRSFLREVCFHLPGGARHLVDWMILRDGQEPLFCESKGRDLPMGRMKRKQVEELYGVSIVMWTKEQISL